MKYTHKKKTSSKKRRATRRNTSKICVACEGVSIDKIVKTNNNIVSSWLKETDYIRNFIEKTPIRKVCQSHVNLEVPINLGKQNAHKYILFFAATPGRFNKIKSSKLAYGDFRNYGVNQLDANGKTKLKFKCPQCYSDDDGRDKLPETFYRHVHFCLSNKNHTNWSQNLYTKIVICKLSYQKTMSLHHRRNIVFINTLPHEYYAKEHIPHSFNLPVSDIKHKSRKELEEWFKEVIKNNYPKLHKQIQAKQLHYYEVPIVTYCAHDKCSASYDGAIELLKKRFVNVSEFSGGMKEYKQHKN